MTNIEPLLLNILFLFIFLLFVPLLFERSQYPFSTEQKKWLMLLISSLAIISCISFPIRIVDGLLLDFRWLPLIFGGLYYGVPGSLLLWGVTNAYRFIYGGDGILANLIISSIILFFLIILSNRFIRSSRKKKLIIGGILSLFSGFTFLLVLTSFFQLTLSASLFFVYLTLKPMTAIFLIYIYEIIQETAYVNRKVIKGEKLEVASQLASSISHEVRNPLAVVRGFLQMMEQRDVTLQERKEYIKISIDELDRANEIIVNYLTFAKPAPDDIKALDIKKELQRIIHSIRPLAKQNNVEIEERLESYQVLGDSQMLQQCFLNITKNCIEAMPNGGKLQTFVSLENKLVTIKIIDTGKGMTDEQLARLGEPYFTTKGNEGTGLGMMAAIQIIKLLNGELTVTSKVDEGSTFQITLPLTNTIVD